MYNSSENVPKAESRISASHGLAEVLSKNKNDQKWEPVFPDLGNDSPLVCLLRVDPDTGAATVMLKFPKTFHFPKHTHGKGETTYIVAGAHLFEDCESGSRYEVKEQGYFYMPAKKIHQAWVPSGTLVLTFLEGGLQADWLDQRPHPIAEMPSFE